MTAAAGLFRRQASRGLGAGGLSEGISSGLGSGEALVCVYGRINVQEESLNTNYWPGESGLALTTISSQHVNSLLQIKLGST